MRINSQLKVVSYVTAFTFIIMIPLLIGTFLEFNHSRSDYVLTESINRQLSKSHSLRNQYILYYNQYVLEQLAAQETEIDVLLQRARLHFTDDDFQQSLQQMPARIKRIRSIFDRIVKNQERMATIDIDQRSTYAELEKRLTSQLLLKTSEAEQIIYSMLNNEALRIQEDYEKLVIITTLFAILLAVTIIAVMTQLGRMINKKLAYLHEGAKIVADGDLNYRLHDVGHDEFSELAESINSVTTNLQSFTQKLKSEIHVRKNAEKNLQIAHDELELRVTARTQELKASEKHLENILKLAPAAIVIVNSNKSIRYFNQAAESIFCYRAKEIIGQSFDLLMPEKFRLRHRKLVETFENSEQVNLTMGNRQEIVGLRKSGEEFPATASVSKLEIAGDTVFTVMLADITERKASEAQLIQADKLATLGTLAAGTSHELRQPLNIIRLLVQSDLMDIEQGSTKVTMYVEDLEKIDAQIQRMSDIISHLNIYSRKELLPAEPFLPNIVVRQALTLIHQQFASENIHIEHSIPDTCGSVNGSAVQMEQVVLNLLSNAHDAVTERLSNVEASDKSHQSTINIELTEGDDQITLTVTDNGGGIRESELSRVFDPFYTNKEVGKGTGLGLSVSHSIIQSMGGNIKAYNIADGACFKIVLPCLKLLQAGSENSSSYNLQMPQVDRHKKSILIVEDEEQAAATLAKMLRKDGHEVFTVNNGIDALKKFRESPISIVVTDLQLPGMNGEELVVKLREISPDIPIIVTTGKTNIEEDVNNFLNHKLTYLLKKPISVNDLTNLILQD